MGMTPPVHEAPDLPRKRSSSTIVLIVLGVVLSVCIGGVTLVAILLAPVFREAQQMAKVRNLAIDRMHGAATGTLMYAADYDDRLPEAHTWMDRTAAYMTAADVHSPGLPGATVGSLIYGTSFRKSLGGRDVSTIVEGYRVALVFDSRLTVRNAASELDTLPDPPRYQVRNGRANAVASADGHAFLVRPDQQARRVR